MLGLIPLTKKLHPECGPLNIYAFLSLLSIKRRNNSHSVVFQRKCNWDAAANLLKGNVSLQYVTGSNTSMNIQS